MERKGWHPLLAQTKRSTRYRILVTLKILGEATAQELSEHLHFTPMGIRRHLSALYKDGLVDYRVVRRGQGRPAHVYYLTPKALGLFDQRYASLSVELLSYLAEEMGEEMVTHLFERRAQRRIETVRPQLEGLSLKEKVERLAQILDEDGYLAEWRHEEESTYILCEHHCAIYEVAKAFPQACRTELTFLQSVLEEAHVQRSENIVQGDHCCTYIIKGAPHVQRRT